LYQTFWLKDELVPVWSGFLHLCPGAAASGLTCTGPC
jgi:hypothetical protein